MKKRYIVASLFAFIALVGVLRAAYVFNPTTYGDIQATNGKMTSTFAIPISTAPRSVSVGVTPLFIGSIVFNTTDNEICVSTGVIPSSWIEVSTTSLSACKH